MSLDVYLLHPLRSEGDEVAYSANITHNLNQMAMHAGLYRVLWRPEELGITHARQLIEPLTKGLALLESDPTGFQALNPPNGWGNYEGLVKFTREYLAAAIANQDAEVCVSR